MAELRWIILALGVLVLAGVYAWGRGLFRRSQLSRQRRRPREEPRLSLEADLLSEPGSLAAESEAPAALQSAAERTAIEGLPSTSNAGWGPATRAGRRLGFKAKPSIVRGDAAPQMEPFETDPGPDAVPRGLKPKRAAKDKPSGSEPGAQGTSPEATAFGPPATPSRKAARVSSAPRTVPEKIITIRLVPKSRAVAGEDAVEALRSAGLQHGRYGIFHKLSDDDEEAALFSAASLTEPGSFDLANLTAIGGLSIFVALPGPGDPVNAFNAMVEAARTLAHALDADLFDDQGCSWSIQREHYVRDELVRYRHQLHA